MFNNTCVSEFTDGRNIYLYNYYNLQFLEINYYNSACDL